ncbi:MAG: MFS transporter [Candidatus Latescibacteria bacterium]|nr:MFS transporter [Candidatus Latescibacterota bacterium]
MSLAAAQGEGESTAWNRAFIALCLVCLLSGFLSAPFMALFPVYVEADLGRMPLFTANLRALMLMLGGFSALVGGRLCDLLGLKRTLMVGLAGGILNGFVFHSSSPWALFLLVFLIGFTTGPWTTAGQSYLISSVRAGQLGMGGAFYFLSGNLGNALGSLITGVLKETWSYQQLGTLMSAGMAGVCLLALWLLPSTTAARSQEGLALRAVYLPLLRQNTVRLLIGLRLFINSFWGMATLLLPLLVYRVSHSESMPAYYASVSLAVAAAGQLLIGVLRDRYGRLWPLLICGAGYALCGLGVGLYWESLPALFVFGTGLTATAWAISTLVPSLINEVAGPQEKSRLVGLLHLVWSTAMVAGSLLGGTLVEIDPGLPFLGGALLAAGGTFCAWLLCRRLDRKEQ